MSRSGKRRRAERWLKRGHINDLHDWDDPSLVKQELARIEDHIRETELRMSLLAKDIADLEELLRDGPAKLERLRAQAADAAVHREKLSGRKATTQLRLGGAINKADAAKLRLRIKRLEEEAAILDSGKALPAAPMKAVKPGEYASGLGNPAIGDAAAPTKKDFRPAPPADPEAGTGRMRRSRLRQD